MRLFLILIFSISAGLNSDLFLLRGDRGGVLPLEKLDVDVDPLWVQIGFAKSF